MMSQQTEKKQVSQIREVARQREVDVFQACRRRAAPWWAAAAAPRRLGVVDITATRVNTRNTERSDVLRTLITFIEGHHGYRQRRLVVGSSTTAPTSKKLGKSERHHSDTSTPGAKHHLLRLPLQNAFNLDEHKTMTKQKRCPVRLSPDRISTIITSQRQTLRTALLDRHGVQL